MRIVYFLGAGFSAPLGLPVMRNFLEKSKDQFYFHNDGSYSYFRDVFQQIDGLAKTMAYFTTNLFDIEEILSLLEVESFVEKSSLHDDFRRYLGDVITFYTPKLGPFGALSSNWHHLAFGRNPLHNGYGYFVAALQGLGVSIDAVTRAPRVEQASHKGISYSVVTTNYDCVLETICRFIRDEFGQSSSVEFDVVTTAASPKRTRPPLAKLHGSVDRGDIVPPTWSKGSHQNIVPAWKTALELLSSANAIRVIGYSLPITDNYVRYLLRVAALRSTHLREIDVLCLDDNGSIKRRYDEFISFSNYRFRSADVVAYMSNLLEIAERGSPARVVAGEALEKTHSGFFHR